MNNPQEELIRILSNVRSLRSFARELNYDLLQTAHEKLGLVLEERKEEEELRRLELEEQEEKRMKALEYIKELGFAPEDLNVSVYDREPSLKPKPKTRHGEKRAIKYRYVDDHGTEHTWTGVGRLSRAFQQLKDAGIDIEQYRIKSEKDT